VQHIIEIRYDEPTTKEKPVKTILSGHLMIAFFLSLAPSAATAVANHSTNAREEGGLSRLEQPLAYQCGRGTEREAICKFRQNESIDTARSHYRKVQNKECDYIHNYLGENGPTRTSNPPYWFPQANSKEECYKLNEERYQERMKEQLEQFNKCMSAC
jgi:hypothetical protein